MRALVSLAGTDLVVGELRRRNWGWFSRWQRQKVRVPLAEESLDASAQGIGASTTRPEGGWSLRSLRRRLALRLRRAQRWALADPIHFSQARNDPAFLQLTPRLLVRTAGSAKSQNFRDLIHREHGSTREEFLEEIQVGAHACWLTGQAWSKKRSGEQRNDVSSGGRRWIGLKQKTPEKSVFFEGLVPGVVVERRRIELPTFALRTRRSPS